MKKVDVNVALICFTCLDLCHFKNSKMSSFDRGCSTSNSDKPVFLMSVLNWCIPLYTPIIILSKMMINHGILL